MHTRKSAFSLVEIMIVLAILTALASMAIPAYNRYLVDSKFSEFFSVAQKYQTEIQESFMSSGSGPADSTVTLNSSVIDTVKLSSRADGLVGYIAIVPKSTMYTGHTASQELIFRGEYSSTTGLVTWTCCQSSSKPLPASVVPEKCSATCTDSPSY